jgi:hypothetical protein
MLIGVELIAAAACAWMSTTEAISEYTPKDSYERGLYGWREYPEEIARKYGNEGADQLFVRDDKAGERVIVLHIKDGCLDFMQEMATHSHLWMLERAMGAKCLEPREWC